MSKVEVNAQIVLINRIINSLIDITKQNKIYNLLYAKIV